MISTGEGTVECLGRGTEICLNKSYYYMLHPQDLHNFIPHIVTDLIWLLTFPVSTFDRHGNLWSASVAINQSRRIYQVHFHSNTCKYLSYSCATMVTVRIRPWSIHYLCMDINCFLTTDKNIRKVYDMNLLKFNEHSNRFIKTRIY